MAEKPLWRMVAGRRVGPYAPAKLRPLVKDGRIGPLDRFSYDGVEWRPAGEFAELLRPPPAASSPGGLPSASGPLDADPLDSEVGTADFTSPDSFAAAPEFVPRLPPQAGSSSDDAQLLRAIYLLIALGGGMFVLLICYIILSSLLGGRRPVPASPAPAMQVVPQQEIAPPAPAGSAGDAVEITDGTGAAAANGEKQPGSDTPEAQPDPAAPTPVATEPDEAADQSGREPAAAGGSSAKE